MPINLGPETRWPPESVDREYSKFREWAAWYSGDPERLADVYAARNSPSVSGWSRFWSRVGSQPTAQKARFHVPVAGDLSSISSALLFGVPPKMRIAEAHEAVDTNNPAAVKTEARLREIIETGGGYYRLMEGAETASAMGGSYLYPAWDEEVIDVPLVDVVQADSAVPQFKFGVLISVVFHRELARDGDKVYRHLELHERVPGGNARILHYIYLGTANKLGRALSPQTLKEWTGLEPMVTLPFPELDVQYIPNMRPNKLWRDSSLGLSDYSGSEIIFDGIDETYAAWMRDIRLAKARLMVPKEFLDELGAFDVDHEIFTPLSMDPIGQQGADPIMAQQFAIRHEAFLATTTELIERVVSNAGYSPQTYGMKTQARADTGAAVRWKESRTIMTMSRKGSWWNPALERLFMHLLIIDSKIFKSGVEPMKVSVELSDQMVRDPVELAQTANVLRQAETASTQERVKMIHPDWTPEEVEAEVKRIMDDKPKPAPVVVPPPPTPGAPMPADAGGPPVEDAGGGIPE